MITLYTFLSFLFFGIAAMFNAAMDSIDQQWPRCFFNWLTRTRYKFMNTWFKSDYVDDYVAGKKKFIPKYLPVFSDGWHFFKGCMIYFIIMAVLLFNNSIIDMKDLGYYVIGGILYWCFVFEIFYNWIFVNKKYRRK